MSYILEALKRAERERRAGTNSLLDEMSGASSAATAPAWQRWIMPAAIFALAAAIVAYLMFGGHRERSPAAPAAVVATPAPVVAAPAPKPVPMPTPHPSIKAEPPPETAASAIEDDGRISSLKDLDDKPAPPSPAAATAPIGDDNEDAESAAATSRTSNAREKPRARLAAEDDTANPRSSIEDAPGSSSSITDTPRSDSAPTVAASTQNLREMPDDFRAGFPAVTVDVHAYSDDPAQRFVLVGGKRYHEGDTLPQGPRIFSIVPEGIVFDWQGQRVLYAMNR